MPGHHPPNANASSTLAPGTDRRAVLTKVAALPMVTHVFFLCRAQGVRSFAEPDTYQASNFKRLQNVSLLDFAKMATHSDGKKAAPYLADDVGELTVANKQDLLKILDEVQYKTVRPPQPQIR